MKRVLTTTAALAAAVVVLVVVSLPPARRNLSAADDGTIGGAMHVHTNRSDGRSDPAVVAQAAARAGLKFVVFTDHGDGTREPDPPMYRSGVLCIDAVEISTNGGHYIAIGMPRAPYPLRGEPWEVVEDVARLGGFGIVAHPDSPKPDLRWSGWSEPFDGIELVNIDTSWRVHAGRSLFHSVPTVVALIAAYPFRSPETLAALLTRSSVTTMRWLERWRRQSAVGVAGADAHAQIGLWQIDPIDAQVALPFPSYETSFRTLSVHIRPTRPLTGNAIDDFHALLDGLRANHAYVAIDGVATPPWFRFTAENDHGSVEAGDRLAPGGALSLDVVSNAPSDFVTRIIKDGQPFGADHHESHVHVDAGPATGLFAVEVRPSTDVGRPGWIVSNPILVGSTEQESETDRGPDRPSNMTNGSTKAIDGWRAETDAASHATTTPTGRGVALDFALAAAHMTHAGAVGVVGGALEGCTGVTFTIRAERPMRITSEIRTTQGEVPQERWTRSVYADDQARTYTLAFRDFLPLAQTQPRTPPLSHMAEMMWVIDERHTASGTSGRVAIDDVRISCGSAR